MEVVDGPAFAETLRDAESRDWRRGGGLTSDFVSARRRGPAGVGRCVRSLFGLLEEVVGADGGELCGIDRVWRWIWGSQMA